MVGEPTHHLQQILIRLVLASLVHLSAGVRTGLTEDVGLIKYSGGSTSPALPDAASAHRRSWRYQQDAGPIQIRLCECEKASGAPNGLGCQKEGWFISNFENQGTWMGGGGLVPLSSAICCRPCLPHDLPYSSPLDISAGGSGAPALGHAVGHAGRNRSMLPVTSASALGQASTHHHPTRDTQVRAPNSASVDVSLSGSANSASTHASSPSAEPSTAAGRQSIILGAGSIVGAGTSRPEVAAGPAKTKAPASAAATAGSQGSKLHAGSTTSDSDGISPVAVVSVGCHPSSGRAYRALQCEAGGASFVTGFTQAERVSSYYFDVYYPVGQALCCTPAVLLSSGEVWRLKRCDCTQSHTKDCGGLTTDKLLWGFAQWRVTRTGEYLPVAPLECCGMCLDEGPPDPAIDCEALNHCNGNGVCALGACECYEGWGGADCSLSNQEGGGAADTLPWWAAALVVIGGIILLSFTSIATRAALGFGQSGNNSNNPPSIQDAQAAAAGALLRNLEQYRHQLQGSDPAAAAAALPLLMALDDAGSAGSHDTDTEQDQGSEHEAQAGSELQGGDGEEQDSSVPGGTGSSLRRSNYRRQPRGVTSPDDLEGLMSDQSAGDHTLRDMVGQPRTHMLLQHGNGHVQRGRTAGSASDAVFVGAVATSLPRPLGAHETVGVPQVGSTATVSAVGVGRVAATSVQQPFAGQRESNPANPGNAAPATAALSTQQGQNSSSDGYSERAEGSRQADRALPCGGPTAGNSATSGVRHAPQSRPAPHSLALAAMAQIGAAKQGRMQSPAHSLASRASGSRALPEGLMSSRGFVLPTASAREGGITPALPGRHHTQQQMSHHTSMPPSLSNSEHVFQMDNDVEGVNGNHEGRMQQYPQLVQQYGQLQPTDGTSTGGHSQATAQTPAGGIGSVFGALAAALSGSSRGGNWVAAQGSLDRPGPASQPAAAAAAVPVAAASHLDQPLHVHGTRNPWVPAESSVQHDTIMENPEGEQGAMLADVRAQRGVPASSTSHPVGGQAGPSGTSRRSHWLGLPFFGGAPQACGTGVPSPGRSEEGKGEGRSSINLSGVGNASHSDATGSASQSSVDRGQGSSDAGKDYDSTAEGSKTAAAPVAAGTHAPLGALSSAMCAVCMEKPIQVALVPCGHANVCRKCSRRLTVCPVCRKAILRRQRLFYSAG